MACLNCGTKACICKEEGVSCGSCKYGPLMGNCQKNCHTDKYEYWEPKENYTTITCSNTNFNRIAIQVATLVQEKQKAYGNSFGKAEEFMKIIYPDGISVDKYKDMLTLVRIWDKIMRIATDKDALGESPYQDILGYCILALNEKENKK